MHVTLGILYSFLWVQRRQGHWQMMKKESDLFPQNKHLISF